ncbi:hypothetical protein [Pseudomonas monteilii]|uniref:hypothetical protein n=1 Tax=Pseudomonas monteilii TaxID=76759 RepID=UPI001CBECA7A|nr:hypothetical protein [Pseudomonas monteilii]MBZ3666253.1 hypothetical protein [Pseudomonas monteilii]MBZ3671597.1 hypothetical protein [Pseudomonas monteilii]
MSTNKVFKLIAGLVLVVALTAYTQTSVPHGAVVFLMAFATFLVGYFAGDVY